MNILKNNNAIDPMSIINKSKNNEYSDKGDSTSKGIKSTSANFGANPIDSTTSNFSINPIDSKSADFSINPIDSKSADFSINPIDSKSGNFNLKNENLNKEINRIKILLKWESFLNQCYQIVMMFLVKEL